MEWNMATSQSHIVESELPELQQKAVDRFKLVGLTIEETLDRQDAARKASDKRRKETREGRKSS